MGVCDRGHFNVRSEQTAIDFKVLSERLIETSGGREKNSPGPWRLPQVHRRPSPDLGWGPRPHSGHPGLGVGGGSESLCPEEPPTPSPKAQSATSRWGQGRGTQEPGREGPCRGRKTSGRRRTGEKHYPRSVTLIYIYLYIYI